MATNKKPVELKRGRPPIERHEVTSSILATGQANMSQLAQMFRTDAKTLPKRLHGVVPAGSRHGARTYDIREAAGRIVTPSYEIEEYIRQMSPQELPPLLGKEYWNGQNARLKFEIAEGLHWPTEDVVAFFGELTNTLRMSLLLTSDGVERETGLSTGQRAIIQRIIDGAIEEMKQATLDKFKDFEIKRAGPRKLPEPYLRSGVDDGNILADDDDGGNILAAQEDEEGDHGI